jgi:hypothetical protein
VKSRICGRSRTGGIVYWGGYRRSETSLGRCAEDYTIEDRLGGMTDTTLKIITTKLDEEFCTEKDVERRHGWPHTPLTTAYPPYLNSHSVESSSKEKSSTPQSS